MLQRHDIDPYLLQNPVRKHSYELGVVTSVFIAMALLAPGAAWAADESLSPELVDVFKNWLVRRLFTDIFHIFRV